VPFSLDQTPQQNFLATINPEGSWRVHQPP
jgi:hypothetical protein